MVHVTLLVYLFLFPSLPCIFILCSWFSSDIFNTSLFSRLPFSNSSVSITCTIDSSFGVSFLLFSLFPIFSFSLSFCYFLFLIPPHPFLLLLFLLNSHLLSLYCPQLFVLYLSLSFQLSLPNSHDYFLPYSFENSPPLNTLS